MRRWQVVLGSGRTDCRNAPRHGVHSDTPDSVCRGVDRTGHKISLGLRWDDDRQSKSQCLSQDIQTPLIHRMGNAVSMLLPISLAMLYLNASNKRV